VKFRFKKPHLHSPLVKKASGKATQEGSQHQTSRKMSPTNKILQWLKLIVPQKIQIQLAIFLLMVLVQNWPGYSN